MAHPATKILPVPAAAWSIPNSCSASKAGDRSGDSPNSPAMSSPPSITKPPSRPPVPKRSSPPPCKRKWGMTAIPAILYPRPTGPTSPPVGGGRSTPARPNMWPRRPRRPLIAAAAQAPHLWVRGSDDLIVADNSFFDFAPSGQTGLRARLARR